MEDSNSSGDEGTPINTTYQSNRKKKAHKVKSHKKTIVSTRKKIKMIKSHRNSNRKMKEKENDKSLTKIINININTTIEIYNNNKKTTITKTTTTPTYGRRSTASEYGPKHKSKK